MEIFLTAEEVIENHINKTSLIFAFLSGELTAYDKNNFDPIDGKELFDFFKHLGNVLYYEMETLFNKEDHPYYQEDSYLAYAFNYAGIWTDPTTKIRYASPHEPNTFERIPWVQLHKEIKDEIELSRKDPDYFEELRREVFVIFGDQIDEIQNGWGATQAEEIVFDSLFKKSEVDKLLKNTESPTFKQSDDIGESERETWLKIIFLLSYSLANELQGDDEVDILNKKGQKKINPYKLASWLRIKAIEMFPDKDNPGHRCGKTTLDKILQEAEEKLSPDVHAFFSPQE